MKIINPYRFAVSSGTLLLDETGLGSATGAYSTARRLRSAYTGSIIRVRRSSDSAEQDIGFSGDEIDTTSLASFCSGTNGYVKTFYDQSGNGNDATQATTGNQAQIVASGSVLTDNGKPAIANSSTSKYAYAGAATSSSSTSVLAVCNVDAAAGTNNLKIAVGFGGSNFQAVLVGYGTYNVSGDENKPTVQIRGNTTTAQSASANTNQVAIIGFVTSETQAALYENNNSEVSVVPATLNIVTSALTLTSHLTGSFLLGAGYFQEAVVWESDLEAYVSTMKSNVNAFYGIY